VKKCLLVLLTLAGLVLAAPAQAADCTGRQFLVKVSTGHYALVNVDTTMDVITKVTYATQLTHWSADKVTVSTDGVIQWQTGGTSATPDDVPASFTTHPLVGFTPGKWRVSVWDSTGNGYDSTAALISC
jgi:hypothetical protein